MSGVDVARHRRKQVDVVLGERALQPRGVTHADLVIGVVLDPVGVVGELGHGVLRCG